MKLNKIKYVYTSCIYNNSNVCSFLTKIIVISFILANFTFTNRSVSMTREKLKFLSLIIYHLSDSMKTRCIETTSRVIEHYA